VVLEFAVVVDIAAISRDTHDGIGVTRCLVDESDDDVGPPRLSNRAERHVCWDGPGGTRTKVFECMIDLFSRFILIRCGDGAIVDVDRQGCIAPGKRSRIDIAHGAHSV
jgi:hypothetical protein